MLNQNPPAVEPVPQSVFRRLLPVILAAFSIRMVVVFFTYRDLPDADKFYEQFGWEMGWIARALATGHGFSSPYWPWSGPTAMQPPLYPALLSVVFRLFGVYTLTSGFIILSINSLFSSLTCIPVYFSANYSLGSRAARIAAWVWALYPFAIYFSAGRVWEYTLTGILFTTSFCIAQRIHRTANPLAWMGWGALAGLTALSNPSTLGTLPFLAGVAAWQLRKAPSGKSGQRWLVNFVLTGVTAAAVLTPWTIRNYRALSILCPVRDNFWLELYDDNGGDTSLDPSFAHPASNPEEMQKWLALGEAGFLKEKHALAVNYIHAHPGFMVHKTIRRFFYYWTGFWSMSAEEFHEQPYEIGNIFQVCCMTFFMLRGIRRFWRFNRTAFLPYLVLIAVFPITYYITHPLMDYRQPIEPAIIVLAIAGVIPWKRLNPGEKSKWIGAERAA
jgi:4-amino-4-deoxy-L-arabinose transferase-like glycosyltransferase